MERDAVISKESSAPGTLSLSPVLMSIPPSLLALFSQTRDSQQNKVGHSLLFCS